MAGGGRKVRVHDTSDILYIVLFMVLVIHLFFFLSLDEINAPCSGVVNCYLTMFSVWILTAWHSAMNGDALAILSFLSLPAYVVFQANWGFRMFEYDDEGICMSSWFGRRCYSYPEIVRFIITREFGARWIYIQTWDNYYYAPYSLGFEGVVREISESRGIELWVLVNKEDMAEIRYLLRDIRREHGTKMMFFQL